MNQRRSVTMGVLIALPIVMLATTFLALPYKAQVMFLDRQRGIVHHEVHYFSVIRIRDGTPYYDLSAYGLTTAPEGNNWVWSSTYRFCWSRESTITVDERAVEVSGVLTAIFSPTSHQKSGKPIFTSAEISRILAGRVPLWNSSRVDREPWVVQKELDAENLALIQARIAEINAAVSGPPTK